eukprot:693177_1
MAQIIEKDKEINQLKLKLQRADNVNNQPSNCSDDAPFHVEQSMDIRQIEPINSLKMALLKWSFLSYAIYSDQIANLRYVEYKHQVERFTRFLFRQMRRNG